MDIKLFSDKAARWMLVAATFSLVLPTALLSLFLVLLIGFWILSGNFALKWTIVRANPAALAAVALFLLYGFGTLYSPVPWEESLGVWSKYLKVLLIPIIVSLLDDTQWRRRAANAFLWGMLLVLAVSYLKFLGWIPHVDHEQGYLMFKNRIAHNIFMAFTFYLLLVRAYWDASRRVLWVCLAGVAAANVLFLVNGRTGQLLLPMMLIFFLAQNWGKRGAAFATMGMAVLVTSTIVFFGQDNLQKMRLFQVLPEIQSHQHEGPTKTSSGLRLEFYKNTLAIAAEQPWLGWGTGSFKAVYALHESNNPYATTVDNPHNEYLLTIQQLGLFGVVTLLVMGWLTWRAANRLTALEGGCLRALVLMIGVGSMFNSLLLDSSEGKFYCLMAGIYLSGWAKPDRVSEEKNASS
jgi:O-antigen ligase